MFTAPYIVERLLEGRESARRFLQHQAAEKEAAKRAEIERTRVHAEPCQEWAEWENLDDWQRAAAQELEQAEADQFELGNFDGSEMTLSSRDHQDFTIYASEDVAHEAAVRRVLSDLENEPELFTRTWLEGYINAERIRDSLMSDEQDSIRDSYDHQYRDNEAKRDKLDEEGRIEHDHFWDEDENEIEITSELERELDQAWDDFIEAEATARLEDPIQYLKDMMGDEDGLKQAIDIGGINMTEAATAAVNEDGVGHFLSSYDGHLNDLPSGAVYVRN